MTDALRACQTVSALAGATPVGTGVGVSRRLRYTAPSVPVTARPGGHTAGSSSGRERPRTTESCWLPAGTAVSARETKRDSGGGGRGFARSTIRARRRGAPRRGGGWEHVIVEAHTGEAAVWSKGLSIGDRLAPSSLVLPRPGVVLRVADERQVRPDRPSGLTKGPTQK